MEFYAIVTYEQAFHRIFLLHGEVPVDFLDQIFIRARPFIEILSLWHMNKNENSESFYLADSSVFSKVVQMCRHALCTALCMLLCCKLC